MKCTVPKLKILHAQGGEKGEKKKRKKGKMAILNENNAVTERKMLQALLETDRSISDIQVQVFMGLS